MRSKHREEDGIVETALKPVEGEALRILIENHAEFVRFLSTRTGSDAVAEDLLQQGLLRAVQHQELLKGHTNVVAWFYTVLRNILIDYYRSQAAVDRKYKKFFDELVATESDKDFANTELGKAICACMARLVPTLRPQYAEAIQRLDLQGEPLEAVARDLEVTTGNLTVRLHRARQALKKSLERSCGTCTEHGCLDCTCNRT